MTNPIAAELERLAEIATPGPWSMDHSGSHRSEQEVHVVMLGPQRLFDTLNSEVAVIECEADDDGSSYRDSQGAANFALIEAYRNHHATIIAALRAAGEVERMREALEEIDARTNSFALGSPMQLINAIARRALAGSATARAAGFTIVKCGMVDALRSARCPSDGRHLVGECYDAKACGCTIGLHLAATNQRDANNDKP